MKKMAAVILSMVMVLTLVLLPGGQKTEAASEGIKVNAFIKSLVTSLEIPVDNTQKEPYIVAANSAGLLKNTVINNNWTADLTRANAAVMINNADEYLHGDTVDTELLKIVLEKRISDIESVPEEQRDAVAKCFTKGIIKGYSNGYYIKNRALKGKEKVSKKTAKTLITLVQNPEKRAKLSPDGMLIRTQGLPKNADKYDYILECYPNSFYEKKFEFMLLEDYEKYLTTDDYAFPVDMKNRQFRNWYDEWPLKVEMDKYLYDWADLAEKYLHYIFNVDYRTVDDDWINGLSSLYAKSNVDMSEMIKRAYIGDMKKNHVVVESSIIVVEPSTFYEYSDYCIRAYVRYRITADNINVKQSDLIYSQYPALDNLKSGVWRTGIFDVHLATNNGSSGDGSDFALDQMTHFIDAYNVPVD